MHYAQNKEIMVNKIFSLKIYLYSSSWTLEGLMKRNRPTTGSSWYCQIQEKIQGLLLERLSNLLRKSNVTLSTVLATREKPFWVRLMLHLSNSFQVAPPFHCCYWHPKNDLSPPEVSLSHISLESIFVYVKAAFFSTYPNGFNPISVWDLLFLFLFPVYINNWAQLCSYCYCYQFDTNRI